MHHRHTTTCPPTLKGLGHERIFYQNDSLQKIRKREQRRNYFRNLATSKEKTQPRAAAGTGHSGIPETWRQDATAGRAQEGLTKAEATANDMKSRGETLQQQRKKTKKRQTNEV